MATVRKQLYRTILAISVAAAITGFLVLDLDRYLSLDFFQQQQGLISGYHAAHPLLFPCLYFLAYLLMAALSIPGATILSIGAGALFGLVAGTVLVSFASTLGACVAFLISRYLLKGLLHDRHRQRLRVIDRGIERDGGYYLFTLRVIPVFPFVIINLLMGITPIRLRTFYWVTQLGMLPITAVYVNAGKQLGELDSPGSILSMDIVFAFVLLGLLPLLARLTLEWLQRRRNSGTRT